MTRTIATEFPRTLLLENLAQVKLASLDPVEVRRASVTLGRFIRDNGAAPVGPLIQRVQPMTGADGVERNETTLMRQSGSRLVPPRPLTGELAGGVSVTDRIEAAGCVLARFRGDAIDVDIVYDKLSVVAYEQEIVLDGTAYLVFAGESGMTVSVDVFASVSSSGRHAHR